MFSRLALEAFVIVLALPAYAVAQHSDIDVIELKPDVIELKPLSTAPISIRMNANTDVVYKTIGKLAGVTVVIDPDVKPQKITVALTNVTVREVLDMVARQSKTVWRTATPNIIFVYPKDSR